MRKRRNNTEKECLTGYRYVQNINKRDEELTVFLMTTGV